METILKILIIIAAIYILATLWEYILALILLVPFLLIVGFISKLV